MRAMSGRRRPIVERWAADFKRQQSWDCNNLKRLIKKVQTTNDTSRALDCDRSSPKPGLGEYR